MKTINNKKNRPGLFILAAFIWMLLCVVACSDSDHAGGTTEETQGIAIVDKVVAGVSQKGPFVNGSSVHLYGLDFETLEQSGSIFTGKIASDKGDFKVTGVNLASQYALLEASGYYRNEVTGEKSKSPITLYAITDLSDRENVNVNLLTHLEYERVMHLVSDTLNVREAKKQAEQEVLKTFYVDFDVKNFEDLNIFNGGEGDAALLAISVLLQGERSEADMSELLANYALDIEKDGKWDDEQVKASIADWSEGIFFKDQYDKIRNNIAGWKMGSVPKFEKYAMNFWWQNYGLGSCTKERQAEVKKNQNKLSQNKDVYFRCNNQLWERTLDVEKDTYQWLAGKDGDVKAGSVNSKNWYVYEESEKAWRPATNELDYTNGINGCTVKREGELEVGDDKVKYLCYDQKWRNASIVNPEIPQKYYFNPDIKYGEFTDTRDGHVYKTVKIGSYTWMAENLQYSESSNFEYSSTTENAKLNSSFYYRGKALFNSDKDTNLPIQIPFHQGICPTDWHIPNVSEWENLISAMGKSNDDILSRIGSSSGKDKYGFSAIPFSYGINPEDNNCNRDYTACEPFIQGTSWLTVGYDSFEHAYYKFYVGKNDGVAEEHLWSSDIDNFYPIRCVQDYPVEIDKCTKANNGALTEFQSQSIICDEGKWRFAENIEKDNGLCTAEKTGISKYVEQLNAVYSCIKVRIDPDDPDCLDHETCEGVYETYDWRYNYELTLQWKDNAEKMGECTAEKDNVYCLSQIPLRG